MMYKEEYFFMTYYIRPSGRFISRYFNRWHIHPNTITIIAFIVGMIGIFLYTFSFFWTALFFIHVRLILDTADGELARATNQCTQFGARLDIILDIVFWFLLFGSLAIGTHGLYLKEISMVWISICLYTIMGIFFIPWVIKKKNIKPNPKIRRIIGVDEITMQMLASILAPLGFFRTLFWIVIIGINLDWILKYRTALKKVT